MAESSGEKTEMPTPKKLRDARNKGQVCTSKDIVSTAVLIVLFATLAALGAMLAVDFETMVAFISQRLADTDPAAVREWSRSSSASIRSSSSLWRRSWRLRPTSPRSAFFSPSSR